MAALYNAHFTLKHLPGTHMYSVYQLFCFPYRVTGMLVVVYITDKFDKKNEEVMV